MAFDTLKPVIHRRITLECIRKENERRGKLLFGVEEEAPAPYTSGLRKYWTRS